MAVALMGGALEPKGIIVIAGTGSIVYGIGDDGVAKRAGGYGQWFADEGSGFRHPTGVFHPSLLRRQPYGN